MSVQELLLLVEVRMGARELLLGWRVCAAMEAKVGSGFQADCARDRRGREIIVFHRDMALPREMAEGEEEKTEVKVGVGVG